MALWVINDSLKIIVAFVFAYALARKSNKEFLDLQELKVNLESRVDEKTKELRLAHEKIATANERRTNYFINLAHETKTPLTLITNYLDRYIKFNGKSHELNILKVNFEKLKNEMIQFLDVEKYERGLVDYDHNQLTNLTDLFTNLIPLYKEHAHLHKAQLTFEVEDQIILDADPSAIERILNNLFENAVKYSSQENLISIRLKRKGENALLIVSDKGIGIEDEKLEKIFEPYYQISHSKLNRQGLGMGLYIIKSIVDSLKGEIEVESEVNIGTTFRVIIPAKQYDYEKVEISENNISKQGISDSINERKQTFLPDRKNILIVEDNTDMRNYLCDELGETYNTFCSENGRSALTQLLTSPEMDLIISDVMMDEMDGYDFRDEISKNGKYSNIPFVFITARSNDMEKNSMLLKGVSDYIYKPFDIVELKAKIQSILINTDNQRKAGLTEAVNVIQNQVKQSKNLAYNKWDNFELRIREKELTHRQIEIVKLIEQGLEYKQIADRLNLSVKTIHRHIQNLFEKLGVNSKLEILKVLFE